MVVVDASVSAKWLLNDEASNRADDVLSSVIRDGAVVPALFPFEIGNVLVLAERRRRIDGLGISDALDLLRRLEITVEPMSHAQIGMHLDCARRLSLTAYDAACVALAARLRATLFTADERLHAAAQRDGVRVELVV